MNNKYPNDADGDALKRIADDGVDMSSPVEFEFTILTANKGNAKVIAEKLKAVNLSNRVSISYNSDSEEVEGIEDKDKDFSQMWTVKIIHTMIPDYEAVIKFQQTLTELSGDIGEPDGWVVGVMPNGQPIESSEFVH